MKHIWTVLCQNSSIDKETNLLSMFSCVEQLNIKIDRAKVKNIDKLGIPININIQLISYWLIENPNEDNVLRIKLELLDPEGKLINAFPREINIKKGPLRFRNIINIKGIKIKKEGRYIFKMTHRGDNDKNFKTVAESPLDIKLLYTM